MPSSYTARTRIEKIATGEQGGSWGDTTNKNFDKIDIAINGFKDVTLSSSNITSGGAYSLALGDSVADEDGRYKMINFKDAGSDITGDGYAKLAATTSEKICIVRNSLSASRALILFQGTFNVNNDVVIPNGKEAFVYFDGQGSGSVVELVFKNAYFETAETTGDLTVGGNISVTGDLTIADDGLKTGTNTSGHILVNDGTNFNPVAVSGDVTISSAGAVTVANDAITNDMIADDAVDTAQLADDCVTNANIAALAVGTTEIAVDAVTNAKVANNAVDTDQIAADAVTNAKIAAGAVDTTELAADAVTNAKIAAGAVDTTELAASAVETAKINDAAVTQAKLATSVTVRKVDTAGDASGWTIEAVGTDLHFKYNGSVVISFESAGKGIFKDDVVAFDSTP